MRIGVDSRPLREAQTSGIPMYVRSLLSAFARLDMENEYVLYAHKPFNIRFPGLRATMHTGARTRYGSIWMQAELPYWLEKDKIDVFWGTQHILPLAMPRHIKAVLTVHDLVHYVFPKTMRLVNLLVNKFIIPPSIHRTDAIVSVSKWTLKDVKKYLNPQNKIMEAIPLGVNNHFYPRDIGKARKIVEQKFKIPGNYLLTVGTFEPRKNINGIFEAFVKVADRIPHHLVVVGQSGWKSREIRKKIEASHVFDRIHLLGYVGDDVLPDIYSAADVFIFPSLYEGFGLPPLEAMACAVPVIASNVSSIPEVVGDAAFLVNPHNTDDIAIAIINAVYDQTLRLQLIQKGLNQAARFQWDDTARSMLNVFQRVYETRVPLYA